MKCIECKMVAEYIFLDFGTGGSFCRQHMVERKKKQAEKNKKLIEKMDEIKNRIDEGN